MWDWPMKKVRMKTNFRYISNYRKLEKGVEPIKKWEIDWKMSILGSVILTVVINLLVFFIIR